VGSLYYNKLELLNT